MLKLKIYYDGVPSDIWIEIPSGSILDPLEEGIQRYENMVVLESTAEGILYDGHLIGVWDEFSDCLIWL